VPSKSSPFSAVLVTGASGLVGSAVCRILAPRARKITVSSCKNPPFSKGADLCLAADLTDLGAADRILAAADPTLVVNCAACPDIAPCEADPAAARRLNAEMPSLLASACRKRGARFVHFSSDQVFDGTKGWYGEDDPPAPVHEYGRTKADGERAVLACNPEAVVIRIALVYGRSPSGVRSASEAIMNAIRSSEILRLYTNEFRTPVLVDDAAAAAVHLAENGYVGLIHVAGPDRVSRLDLGRAVSTRFGLDEGRLSPALSEGLAGKPPRPLDLSLDASRAADLLPFPLRGIDEGLMSLETIP
jgi:dTDP-4-dehydrorhamnose reductase